MRQSADMVNQMTSAERILEYCQLEPEKQPKKPKEISQSWPTEGKIVFQNVFYRYFEEAEPVLRHLSFQIKPREKIGSFFQKIKTTDQNLNIIQMFKRYRWSYGSGEKFIDWCHFSVGVC